MSKATPSTKSQLLEKRYPELSFLLNLNSPSSQETSTKAHQDIEGTLASIPLEKIEVLYIHGIGHGHYATALTDWLNENHERDLVFIEENLEALRQLIETDLAEMILSHPQIHIRILLDETNWEPFLEECANTFPYEHVEMIHEGKEKERLYLLRRSVVHHAIHMEERFHHLFFDNVSPNLERLSTAFSANNFKDQFKNVPAIICGAGPSLQDELETLAQIKDQALVFAGGSAIAGLSHAGILPHFGVAIDPNFEEYDRFKSSSAFEIPLLYTNRLHPRVFETRNGPHGYISAKTGGPIEAYFEKELGIEEVPLQGGFSIEALSVTTTAIELAATMGCHPIILAGVDLAFTNKQSYASGIVCQKEISLSEKKEDQRAAEQLLELKDRFGNPVYTLVKWIMESEAISSFAKTNPAIKFINATSGGIGFEGIPYNPIKEIDLPVPSDLSGKVHQLIEQNRLNPNLAQEPRKKLLASLKEAQAIIEFALKELERIKDEDRDPNTGRMIFYQMELEGLEAYQSCLKVPSYSFGQIFCRQRRSKPWEASTAEKFRYDWEFLHSKYQAYQRLVNYYLNIYVSN